jgi:hypothetical protein
MDHRVRITPETRLRPSALARVAPEAAILECAGQVDRSACERSGILVYPPVAPQEGHVARTIGEILYAPIIELHTAGLRVGEIMSRARAAGLTRSDCEKKAIEEGPGGILRS